MTNSKPRTPKSSSIRTRRTPNGPDSSGTRIRKKKSVKFASDKCSTPTTTRTRSTDGRRTTYLVYRPLELDNESSSEPIIVVDEPKAITYNPSPVDENCKPPSPQQQQPKEQQQPPPPERPKPRFLSASAPIMFRQQPKQQVA